MNTNKFKIAILALTTTLFLASCSADKNIAKTDLKLPDSYREKITVTGDSIQLPWKTFFKDAQLVSLIDKALVQNNEVSTALKNMEQLDLVYKQAKLSLLPTLNFNASANRNYPSENSLSGLQTQQFLGTKYLDDYNANLQLSWEVDIWGKASKQKAAAKADYFAQKENLSALKTRIIAQVAQAYYTLISLDEQLKIAQQNSELNQNSLKMMRLQFDAGQINSLAVSQMEAQLKTAELVVATTQQSIAIQENALSILAGEYPTKIQRGSTLENDLSDTNLQAGIPAQLLSHRPDLKAAEFAVKVANAKTGLSKVAMYPSFSLSPQIGVNSYKFNNWFDLPGSLAKTLAVNLTQPLFQKKALKTAYKTAVIEQEKAVINFKQTVLVAVGEVSDAMVQRKAADERLKLIQSKTSSLDKATIDATKLYNNGMATYLEVITIQSNKLQNDLEANTIKLDKLIATINLYKALGGGVE